MRKMKPPKPCSTCNMNKMWKEFWLLAVSEYVEWAAATAATFCT